MSRNVIQCYRSGDFLNELMKIGNDCFINNQCDKEKIKCMCGKTIINKNKNKLNHITTNSHVVYLLEWVSDNDTLYLMNEEENKEYINNIIVNDINGD